MPSRGFTKELWSAITPIYDAILCHPFIRGLTDGTLERKAFRFYVIQDALYLREYARALSLCAVKAPDGETGRMFNAHAGGAVEVEQELHRTFLRQFRVSQKRVDDTPMAPTTRAYTSYLLSVAYGRPFCEALAVVLPCYWIYREVGLALIRTGSPDALYQRWIDTYGGEAFGEVVRQVLAATDRVARPLGAEDRDAMVAHFTTTSRYEWMFWDMGYRCEAWPV